MKYIIKRLLFCFFMVGFSPPNLQAQNDDFVEGAIYYKITDNTAVLSNTSTTISLQDVPYITSTMILEYGIQSVDVPFHFANSSILQRTFRMNFTNGDKVDDLIENLQQIPDIEYAERIPVDKVDFTPNDLGASSYNGQWGLHKINAQQAWDIDDGHPNIVVAVVDDAVQTTHPDLTNKCIAGWNLPDNNNNPNPPSTAYSHGTHVAGIVGAETHNGQGVSSIGYNISIMPIRASNDPGYITHAYAGVVWAADNGADVINMSWGGSGSSTTNQNVINYAWNKGVILVAAAGNTYNYGAFYPASYNNVVSVAATDINDQKTSFSTYHTSVDVSAPGISINSTVPFNSYAFYQGTSMASPMVAGLCGLVWSANTSLNQQDVIDCITTTTDNINPQNPSYIGWLGSGRINAYQALLCATATNCTTNKSIYSTYPPGPYVKEEVSNSIWAYNNINSGANVRYDAGYEVTLRPNFDAVAGSDFHAVIDGCGGVYKVENDALIDLPMTTLSLKAYPNPFSTTTQIEYNIPEPTKATISVYNNMGQEIKRLADAQAYEAGRHTTSFDGSNLPDGIYILTIQTNNEVISKKLILSQ